MRLIDADALKEESYRDGWAIDVVTVEDIDNAPTVELTEEQAIDKLHETGWLIRHDKEMTERQHGKWISNNKTQPFCNPGRSCSLCGKIVEFSENFCPKCGADMRGDNNENNDQDTV